MALWPVSLPGPAAMAQPQSAAAAAGPADDAGADVGAVPGGGGVSSPPQGPAGPDEEEEDEGEEAKPISPRRGPHDPTRVEWEAHQATHLPFRSWCPHCVAGRSDNPPHRRAQEEEEPAVQEVHFDYAYVRRDEEEEATTLLIAKHRQSKMSRAWQ